jgi:two-component system, OmpR family, sensor kinase
MFFKSIRFKIVIWYIIILVLVLSLFSTLVYFNLRKALNEKQDDMLQLKAEGIADSIDTYWEVEKNEGLAQGASREVFSKVNNVNFIKIAQRWVKEQSSDPELLGILVSIFGPTGEKIASSGEIAGIDILYKSTFKEMLLGHNRFENRTVQATPQDSGQIMSVFTMPVVEDDTLVYIVQVAMPMTYFQNALNKLRLTFFILVPLVVLLSSIAGLFLAALIIKPLKKIIRSVRHITAENLKLRIKIPDTKDEIKELIDTFNTMLEKLDESFSSQKQLTQDISHELRTPLTIMRGEIEVALKRVRSPGEYITVLNSSLEEIARLSLLVENLLILSRFDSREIRMEMQPFTVIHLLRDISSDVKLLAGKKGIEITLTGADRSMVTGDKDQLRRAFLNIIYNSIKYTDDNGKISIHVDKKNNGTQIRISDNGIGISTENMPLLFNRFFRADQSRSSGGYGLGLSICKSIIEAHKGSLSIESILGHGTTVIIDLPD